MLGKVIEGNFGTAWCFLKINDPLVAWETYRGEIISSDYYHDGYPIISPRSASVLRMLGSKIVATNELLLESVRQKYFPNKVSRLTGAFLFENKADADRAIAMWGDEVGHFNPFALTEVNPSLDTYCSKHDSNWITFYLGKESLDLSWMHHYWNGDICPEYNVPLWELIACTRCYICNNELRQQAYNNIRERFNTIFSRKTLSLLEQARLAAYLGSDLGHSTPYLMQTSPDTLTVRYIISMVDAKNPEYLERLYSYVRDPKNTKYINFRDLNIGKDEDCFAVPDFRKMEFSVNIPDVVLKTNFNVGGFAHLS